MLFARKHACTHRLKGLVIPARFDALKTSERIEASNHPAKYGVLAVQVRSRLKSDVKL